jgi:hypothetical protein
MKLLVIAVILVVVFVLWLVIYRVGVRRREAALAAPRYLEPVKRRRTRRH